MALNKTAQENSQNCTKLHSETDNEVRNVLNSEIYLKIELSLCFSFVKLAKKFTSSIEYSIY